MSVVMNAVFIILLAVMALLILAIMSILSVAAYRVYTGTDKIRRREKQLAAEGVGQGFMNDPMRSEERIVAVITNNKKKVIDSKRKNGFFSRFK